MPSRKDQLPTLVEIVREAGVIAVKCREEKVCELKPDGSIVTNGDREVETFLRKQLKALIPGSTVFGEEFGHEGDSPQGLWVVDPIDGTSNYNFGSPLWGVSVGLLVGNKIELGVVFLPDIGEMYSASPGEGATCNGEPLAQVPHGAISNEELVSYHDSLLLMHPSHPWPGKMRYSGAFVVDAMWVVRQRFRGLVGVKGRIYDIAASALIASEVGIQICYADGTPMDFEHLKDGKPIGRAYSFLPSGADLRFPSSS